MKRSEPIVFRRLFIILAAVFIVLAATLLALAATQTDIIGPAGSESFGQGVIVLANGNIVVIDPGYDAPGPITDTGAVYLYSGATGALISRVTGSTAYDQIGSNGVVTLSNGNYVVLSSSWDNGVVTDAGAVTWGNGTTGITGTVSTTNSLVGSTMNNRLGGYDSVTALSNGNYVVRSSNWDNGAATAAGAVTWGNGITGITGVVSITNSLVGSTINDQVGDYGVVVLSNGNYVVRSPNWDNGAATAAGAVTWGNGMTGITGTVSAVNSLVGSTAIDWVGEYDIVTLSNGNYIVRSPYWDNGAVTDAGAVTWGSGTTGITGAVSVTNSLVGSASGDIVDSVVALSNGNYVVQSPYWDNGMATDAGAVTWGNGTTGTTGVVTITNSLVGSMADDHVGNFGVVTLSNGNYVVLSPGWDNGAMTNAGAVTWGNGATGITGIVTVTNSLVGNTASDMVGIDDVTELSNGNYVVFSPSWDNGAVTNAGAVTWGNGTTGITGVVSITNSLVGSSASDQIGSGGITALNNGNYVVHSPLWDNSAVTDVGAVTWGNGTTGITGVVSITNSLVGSSANDRVSDAAALSNGNYVVLSRNWDDGAVTDVGAVTWGNGTTGNTGTISAVNSLVGSTADDHIGSSLYYFGNILVLSNGNYVVQSPDWDNGALANAGAVTWGNGTTGITGVISITNSLVGSTMNDYVGAWIVALRNDNYVVSSPEWDNDAVTDVGAVTWGNGTTGITGVVSITNSLVGSTASDRVSNEGIIALSNGNYVVKSVNWDNGTVANAGAVTWGNGMLGITGVVSITNSLVGSTVDDMVGYGSSSLYGVTELSNGTYVIYTPLWNNGVVTDTGAVTWGNGHGGTIGPITADNSVRGSTVGGGWSLNFGYDYTHNQLVVGRPADNIVTLFSALPHLTLSKSVVPNTDVPYHGVVTYTVVLNNADSISDTTVLVTDTLPLGVTFGQWLEAPDGVIRNGNAITWTGTLTHGTAITLAFTALHIGAYGDTITNTAYFSGAGQVGSASAAFSVVPLMHTVTAHTTGAGSGIISSAPAGIDCGASCSAMFSANSQVILTATPLISSTFTGWSGDVVTTTNPIAFTLDADKSVTATFALKTFVITPTAGVHGTITPNTPQTVNYGAGRTFTITADIGYRIVDVGVDGVSMGALSTYTFSNITANHIITATFASDAFTLTVNYAGTGRGSVLLNPPGPGYTAGSVVTLTAVPSSTSAFAGWSGDVVTTTNPLVLIMDTTKSVTATFTSYRVYLPMVRK